MPSHSVGDGAPDTYREFVRKVERIWNVGTASKVLNWDQEVMMPSGGTPARSDQLSALSAVSHDLLTDDEMAGYLEELAAADLTGDQRAVVREIRRKHDRATRVPTDLVEEMSRVTSEAHPVWTEAREADSFESFAPTLERVIDLKREYAEYVDPDADPYEVLFDDYEPYLGFDTAEHVLERLRDGLVPVVEAVSASDADLATDAFAGTFDPDAQEALARDVLDTLGYDWNRGRLDRAPHPFSMGTQYDVRIATRFDETDLLGGLLPTIHEFGHATYTQGLADEYYGTPLGGARDLLVHESQSRLWENHVGRSRAFWELVLPTVRDRFPALEDVTAGMAYEAANQVHEDNLVRIEADELTYHMHVVVRFEIEKALVRGDLDVAEVPEVWADKYDAYLGVRPRTHSEGCLQDIHWSHGSFGYFPTYSLGSVLGAQLFAAAEDDVGDLHAEIRAGRFADLHDWLTEHVHQHGQRYRTDELVRRATGEEFTVDYFLEYVTEKYGALYGL